MTVGGMKGTCCTEVWGKAFKVKGHQAEDVASAESAGQPGVVGAAGACLQETREL